MPVQICCLLSLHAAATPHPEPTPLVISAPLPHSPSPALRPPPSLLPPCSAARVSAGDVHQIIRGYLLHYGYAASLAAFDAAAGMAALDDAGGDVMAVEGVPAEVQQQQQQPPSQQQRDGA